MRYTAAGLIGVMGLVQALAAGGAALAQDAGRGEQMFRRCAACHQIGGKAVNRVGPVLTGVVGRRAGSYPGYAYGASMTAAGEAGLTWDEEQLMSYLEAPTPFLRAYLDDPRAKARMRFRLSKEADRRDVIAYLATVPATFGSDAGDGVGDGAEGAAGTAETAPAETAGTAADALCVRNASADEHLFAVEADGAGRAVKTLPPGERLCVTGARAGFGVVSVFERADALEGCSRIVAVGQTEEMRKYVDFDRCFWSSNS